MNAIKENVKYELRMYFFLFMMYSFLGWVYETILFSVDEKHFVNRGFNFGPYIPIYGFGAVIITLCIVHIIGSDFRIKGINVRAFAIFLLIAVLSTVAELLASYIMEYSMGIVLWDYGHDWLNFQGRIAPRASFIFGSGGLVLFYTIQPMAKKLIDLVSTKGQKIFATILLLIILIDFGISTIIVVYFHDTVEKTGIIERK